MMYVIALYFKQIIDYFAEWLVALIVKYNKRTTTYILHMLDVTEHSLNNGLHRYISLLKTKHLKTLLLGPPFDEKILVKKTFCLVPDSSIFSIHWLHTSSMPHLENVWTRTRLLNAGLSCKEAGKEKKESRENKTGENKINEKIIGR